MIFVPENRLEEAMLLAASQDQARPHFYRLLMESELFVLGDPGSPEAVGALLHGGRLALDTVANDGQLYHPIFTSAQRMQHFAGEPVSHFRMLGRILFAGARGAHFVINPKSELGKTLVPEEIAYWMAQLQATQPVAIRVGQPKVYPKKLVKALCVLFISRSLIAEAHLAFVARDDGSEAPHPLIGLVADGDVPRLIQEIFEVAATAIPGTPIDVVYIDPQGQLDPLRKHVLSIEPFFRRAPGATLN
ncbi:MAG: enhanced serine sensitivity protein SseB C-terminal domain-containing protein [Rhizomicrobium sp.]